MEGMLTGVEVVARDPSLLKGLGRCAAVTNQVCRLAALDR